MMKLVAILLVAGLSSQLVAAGGFLGLFAGRGKEYKMLAEHLFEATQSSELAENTKAAESLLSKKPEASKDLVELVNAFKSLRADTKDMETLCSKDNLANMRIVAEAMREGGNLGPNKITEPIRRLNRMLVAYIAEARPDCPPHLDTKWPEPWKPKFSEDRFKRYVRQLHKMPGEFLWEGYWGESNAPQYWGLGVSEILRATAYNDRFGHNMEVDPDERRPSSTTNKTVLALQLHEYVYRPCEEFVTLPEAHDVLVPYNNLLMSWYLINERLNDYFQDREEPRVKWGKMDKGSTDVKFLAFSYRTCERLLPMSEKDVLAQTIKSRKFDQKSPAIIVV